MDLAEMNSERAEGSGRLILAGAPIGRPQDASASLVSALRAAEVIAVEDTRRLRRLARELDVHLTGRLVSYYEDVEAERVPGLIDQLTNGRDVLLITDAGMPGISDPGYRLVTAAIGAGIDVTVLPGPSAVTAALAVSGLPTDRFCFEGFPPRKVGERARRFADLATEPRTMVFFESPRRLAATLSELSLAFGPGRRAVVCRELTKTHEEILRGTVDELARWAKADVLGEITLVVAGAPAIVTQASTEEILAEVAAAQEAGSSRSDAITDVAARLGLRKRDVYDVVVNPHRH
ncbi:MAG TPA: 16S rRNA (cytidine(1402)-2'-O)-methyltransferase [Streptosporangiaceae bacterium]|nr:16S rRNA (cytidine(1402)-2'-O)-methyltransferase [Streptosporangiaceae bacterium]